MVTSGRWATTREDPARTTACTFSPAAARWLHRWRPTKPLAPVTSTGPANVRRSTGTCSHLGADGKLDGVEPGVCAACLCGAYDSRRTHVVEEGWRNAADAGDGDVRHRPPTPS